MSGAGAWEQVATSGERAIQLARQRPGTLEADSALTEHQELLGQAREQGRRVRFIAEKRAPPALAFVGFFVVAFLTLLASRVAGHLSRQLSRPLDELVGWTARIANAEPLPLPLHS